MRRGVGAGSSRSGVDRHRAAGSRCEPSDASHDRTTKPVMVPSCCGGRASFVATRSIPAISSRILTWVGALQPGFASGARASTKAVSSTVMSSISIVSWRSCSSRPCARRTTILVGSRSALLRLCGCGLARQWHVQPPSTQGIVQIPALGGLASGVLIEIHSRCSGSRSHPLVALGKNDGASAFTRIPRPPHCAANSRVRAATTAV